MEKADPEKEPIFRELSPEIPEDRLEEAEEKFNQYIDLIVRMFERIRKDSEQYVRFKRLLAEEINRKTGNVAKTDW